VYIDRYYYRNVNSSSAAQLRSCEASKKQLITHTRGEEESTLIKMRKLIAQGGVGVGKAEEEDGYNKNTRC
jgi:hypothetical protein